MRRPLPIFLLTVLLSAPVLGAGDPGTLTQPHPYGATLPPACTVGEIFTLTSSPLGLHVCTSIDTWTPPASGGGVPAGLITFVITGACPSGWSEVTALAGKTLVGTLAANVDVGTTGGNDSITPTVNALSAAAQTFTGDSTTVPALAYGTLANAWPAGTPTIAGVPGLGTLAVTAHTVVATKQGASAGNVVTTATHAFTGALTAGTLANTWPAGVPTHTGSTATGALTPLGHNAASAVTGTLNSFDNRSAFTKVIFCSKN
jgi:hypothetical protein